MIRPCDYITDTQIAPHRAQRASPHKELHVQADRKRAAQLSPGETRPWCGGQGQFQMNRNRLAESWLGSRIRVTPDCPAGSSETSCCGCWESEHSPVPMVLQSICQHNCRGKRGSHRLPTLHCQRAPTAPACRYSRATLQHPQMP